MTAVTAARGYRTDPELGLVYGVRGRPVGSLDSSGYLQVDARSHGGGMLLVHRLIWESVHGPIADRVEINHVDGVKTHNGIRNLEAIDHAGNIRHAYRIGLASNAGQRHPQATLTDAQVLELRRRYVRYSRTANARVLADELGVNRRAVAAAVSGESWSHLGGPG